MQAAITKTNQKLQDPFVKSDKYSDDLPTALHERNFWTNDCVYTCTGAKYACFANNTAMSAEGCKVTEWLIGCMLLWNECVMSSCGFGNVDLRCEWIVLSMVCVGILSKIVPKKFPNSSSPSSFIDSLFFLVPTTSYNYYVYL